MVASIATHQASYALLEGIAIATNKLLTITDDYDSVQQALTALGESTDVDRIYIFENHPHPETGQVAVSQRWEWVSSNVKPEIDNPDLQNVDYENFSMRWYNTLKSGSVISGWVEDFPESERAFLDPQGIKSILIVPIIIRSEFWGLVGFDDCHSKRLWTDVEKTALLALGGSIGGSIVQRRGEIQMRELNATLEQKVRDRTQELQQEKEETERQNHILASTLEELKNAQSQLIQTEKMSDLGKLVASIAHEINNPINFIGGNLKLTESYFYDLFYLIQLYEKHFPDSAPEIEEEKEKIDLDFLQEDVSEMLSSTLMGVGRISEIIKSLRTFSRSDKTHLQEIDLHSQIDDTLTILETRLRGNFDIKIVRSYSENLPLIECYAGQLSQVFMNILSNAIDAFYEVPQPAQAGVIDAPFCEGASEDHKGCSDGPCRGTICICTRFQNDMVVITIADNGPGMSATTQEKLFEPFFTTKAVGKGTGLGMAIAHRVVTERHGGTISCASELGQGTTFTVTLPLKPVAPGAVTPSTKVA
ncbi:MAG: ATP-binding protein [Cyanobacteria bacterium P01_C01_bin.89]